MPGDCFCSLAKANNFFDYLTVYNHASNSALKAKRPNPNQLVQGDSVEIPDKEIKKVPGATNKEHKFVVVRTKTKLRLAIVDSQGTVVKAKACTLKVGSRSQKTLPASNGLVEMEIDPVETAGSLAVTWTPPKPPAAPKPAKAAALPSPPPYPAPIVSGDFTDATEDFKAETSATWNLHVGSMEPKDTVRGALRRLINLGYGAPDANAEDAKTAAVVKSYQHKNALAAKGSESGKVADVQANLEARHDNL